MNDELKPSAWTVASLMKKYPQATHFFITQKTTCPSCYLTAFCTVSDVVAIYGLEAESFYAALNKVITNPNQVK